MTVNEEIHVGDVGTVFEITVKEGGVVPPGGISLATTKEFVFVKPSQAKVTKTAVFKTNGTDGKLVYSTITNDLDEAGVWALQAHVVEPGKDHMTEITKFRVFANL